MLNKSAFDLLVVAFGPLGSALASLGLVLLLSWSFDPLILSVVAIIELISLFFVMALTFGFDQAYVREYEEAPDKKELFASAMIVPGILCMLSGFVILLVLYISHVFLLPRVAGMGNVIAISYGMSSLLIRLLSSSVRMSKPSIVFSCLQIIPRSMTLMAITACLILIGDIGERVIIICYLFGSLTSLAAHAIVCNKELIYMFRYSVNCSQLRLLFRFGWPTAVGAILYTLLSSTDRLSLALFGTDYDLGVYSVAVSVAGTVSILTLVFSLIWAPMVYQAEAHGAERSSVVPYLDIIVISAFLASNVIAALAWMVQDILPSEYVDVIYYVPACMSLPVLYVLAESFGIGIALSRKTQYSLAANATGACVAVVISFIMVPSQGAAGAAFAVLAGSLAFLVVRAELSAKLWYEYPRAKMYMATFVYCFGCVVSLWNGKQLGWLFPIFWLTSCVIVIVIYIDKLRQVFGAIQEAVSRR